MRTSFAAILALAAVGAHGQTITVTPKAPSLQAGGTQAFAAHVHGLADDSVAWLVNGIPYGAPQYGTIGPGGVYTAPVDAASSLQVPVEAASLASPLVSGSATATVAPPTLSGTQFYVATTGLDTNDGSAGAPWLTIQHAVTSVSPGATINVAAGIYNELVTITTSGSAGGGFISLVGATGAIIDGSTPNALPIPNGEAGLITISDASYIRVSGLELRNYTSASAANDPVGIYVIGSGQHIELLNNHIHNITTTVTTSAGDALGIAVYGTEAPQAIEYLVIDGNELDDLVTGFSESLAISGNVKFWQVTNNLIHDNDNIGIDIAGFEGFAPNPAYDRARRGLIAGNTIYNISSTTNPAYGDQPAADGIYVDGGTEVTIQQNLVYADDYGIELASEHFGHSTTDVTARDNVVYQSNVGGITIGGYAANRGGTANCTIVNNTLYDNDTTQSGTGEFQIQYHARNNVFKDNILYANAQGLLVNSFVATETAPAAMNKNLYYTSAATPQFIWLNQSYSSLAVYQKGAGVDRKSLYDDPLFVSTTGTPDLQVQSGSPAIGAGRNLGLAALGLYDFAGNPRTSGGLVDIGAYQN